MSFSKYQAFIHRPSSGCIYIWEIEDNGDIIHSSKMADLLGHRTSISDNNCMISAAIASFWKTFTLIMSDFIK